MSADKRFIMYFYYIPLRLTPDRGFCEAVCNRKITKKDNLIKNNHRKKALFA